MKKIVIDSENSGKRIDKFLTGTFFGYTRGDIIRAIKNGEVIVNGKMIKPSYELDENDVVIADFSEKSDSPKPNRNVAFDVIYQDENIVAVDKPAGLQMHPGAKNENDTLINGLVAKFPEIINVHDDSAGAQFRPGIVHRLDKNTSGVVVIARNKKSFDELKKIFQQRLAQKHYVAIVYGMPKNIIGVIDNPIARSESYKKQIVARKGTKTIIRNAVTEYEVIKNLGIFSLVDVFPKTGRMHQIRVHLASIGNPVVGDEKYAPKKLFQSTQDVAKRHLLHAKSIKFALLGKNYDIEAELPADFGRFWASIDGRRVC